MSQVVANTMLYAVWRNLADLAFHYRGKRVFAPELVRSMSAVTPPDLKTMHRFSLVEILSTVELFQTAEGRAKAGLPAHDDADTIEENAAATLLSKHLSETQAKLIIVRESRALWKEICSPGPASARRNQLTRQRMRVGLAKFPYALGICESLLLLQQDPYGVIQQDQARRLLFRGVSRALVAPSIPKKLDIKDIRSPIDNSPMQYTFDGSRLTVAIRLSRFRKDGMFSLTFPPKPKRASK